LFDKSIQGNFINELVVYGAEKPSTQPIVLDIIKDIMNNKFVPIKVRDLDPTITDSEIVERMRQYDNWSCAGLSQVLKDLHYVFNLRNVLNMEGSYFIIDHDTFTRAGLKFDAFLMQTPCGGRFLSVDMAEYCTFCNQVEKNEIFILANYDQECQKNYLAAIKDIVADYATLGKKLEALAKVTKDATVIKHFANYTALNKLRLIHTTKNTS
jgi:hypothetical protein